MGSGLICSVRGDSRFSLPLLDVRAVAAQLLCTHEVHRDKLRPYRFLNILANTTGLWRSKYGKGTASSGSVHLTGPPVPACPLSRKPLRVLAGVYIHVNAWHVSPLCVTGGASVRF